MSTTNNQVPPSVSNDAPKPLTRSLLISPNHEKVATALPTMFISTADGRGIKEVPVPESVKATGVVPEGYCVDFAFDPDTAIVALAKQGIVNTSQLKPGALEEIIAILNGPDNLAICPKSVYDEKRAATLSALEKLE